MKTYPIFILIEDKPCLVVGGGAVGERKVLDLREAGARVTVLSQTLTPTLTELAQAGQIRYLNEAFTPDHLNGMVLAMAATDDREVNARLPVGPAFPVALIPGLNLPGEPASYGA